MKGRYINGAEYEYETALGLTRRMKVVRSTRQSVWFLYNTEKTRRVIRVERKDKKWKEKIRFVPKG